MDSFLDYFLLSPYWLFYKFREARQCIRWLERELSRGHKGLQAQETEEQAQVTCLLKFEAVMYVLTVGVL